MPYRLSFLAGALSVLLAAFLPAANVPPESQQMLPTYTVARGSPLVTLDLDDYFRDPDVTGTAVRLTVRRGTQGTAVINLALFDAQTPLTVANFLAYLNAGRYQNNIIHRNSWNKNEAGQRVSPFVIQGGGFRFVNNTTFDAVATFPAIQNEPGISNLRGTVAMAKVGNDPNSATSQWFINLSDQNAFLDEGPPVSNSFTVFARVLGDGMTVVDDIAGLPDFDASQVHPAWNELPLTAGALQRQNFVETNAAVVPALSFSVTSSNTPVVTANVSGNLLRFKPSTTRNGPATITVTATDLEGATVQKTFLVTVLAPPTFTVQPPASATVLDGGTLNLTATTSGGPPIYQWERLPAGSRVWVNVANGGAFSGATTPTLTITGATASMNGDQYRLRVTNGIAKAVTSRASKLVVSFKPVVTTQPANTVAKAPAVVTLKAAATANPAPSFRWETSTDGGSNFTPITNGAPFSGATTGLLKITTNANLHGRQFRCVISNSVGTVTTLPATLTVTAAPKFVTVPPATQTVNAGGEVTLTVLASGNPTPTYQWKKNNVAIPGATGPQLKLNPVLPAHAGSYTVVASNGVAPVATSKAAKLVVNYAPVFSLQPKNTVTVKNGKVAVFRVTAAGLPKTTKYQWEYANIGQGQGQGQGQGEPVFLPLVNGPGVKGATTASLQITANPGLSGRIYRCVASNTIGSTTSTIATLSVTQ